MTTGSSPGADAKPRLLFFCLHESTFVRTDLELLPERYDVRKCSGHGLDLSRIPRLVVFALNQLVWLIRNIRQADMIYGWFADYHMVLPVFFARFFNKPCVVVLAGFDSNHLPEIKYGVYASAWRAPAAKYVLRNATLLLPLTETLIYSENSYTHWPRKTSHGVRVHSGPDHAPYRAIPTGYLPERWPMGPEERSPSVVTVAFMDSVRTAYVKGIDVFIAAARLMPEVPFTLIGVNEVMQAPLSKHFQPPPNVHFLPPASPPELVRTYGETSVYAQFSRTEGVPSVLCEAMLCGCVPVGSRVFGIQEIIGGAGFLLDSPEADAVASAIRVALEQPPPARHRARRRIEERYHLNGRREALFHSLEELDARPAR